MVSSIRWYQSAQRAAFTLRFTSTFQTEREVLVQLFEKLGFFMDHRESSPSLSRARVYLPIKAAVGKGLPALIASAALRRAVCAS
jgi:hypothetical protein